METDGPAPKILYSDFAEGLAVARGAALRWAKARADRVVRETERTGTDGHSPLKGD